MCSDGATGFVLVVLLFFFLLFFWALSHFLSPEVSLELVTCLLCLALFSYGRPSPIPTLSSVSILAPGFCG